MTSREILLEKTNELVELDKNHKLIGEEISSKKVDIINLMNEHGLESFNDENGNKISIINSKPTNTFSKVKFVEKFINTSIKKGEFTKEEITGMIYSKEALECFVGIERKPYLKVFTKEGRKKSSKNLKKGKV